LNARESSGAQERAFSRRFLFNMEMRAHLVVFAHINLQVKHLTQICEGEKQSRLLSTTSPLWFTGSGEE